MSDLADFRSRIGTRLDAAIRTQRHGNRSTHPLDNYLFVGHELVEESGAAMHSTTTPVALSDHCPVIIQVPVDIASDATSLEPPE